MRYISMYESVSSIDSAKLFELFNLVFSFAKSSGNYHTDDYVYLLSDERGCKIGKTNNLLKRLDACKTANIYIVPLGICFPDICESGHILENKLHRTYSRECISREWFNLNDSDVARMSDICFSDLITPRAVGDFKEFHVYQTESIVKLQKCIDPVLLRKRLDNTMNKAFYKDDIYCGIDENGKKFAIHPKCLIAYDIDIWDGERYVDNIVTLNEEMHYRCYS